MFLSPEFFEQASRRSVRAGLWAPTAVALLVAGCASSVDLRDHASANSPETPLIAASAPSCQPTPMVCPAVSAVSLASDAITSMLAYAERARRMQPPELTQEVARLTNATGPTEQVQLALVLSQLRQLPELIRAQELLARVLANTAPEAQALRPLVGLLAARFGEQRRQEDLLDKQTQQTREVQRRLDQTHERLEALKAIERSLTKRPPSAPAANSRGSHTPTP